MADAYEFNLQSSKTLVELLKEFKTDYFTYSRFALNPPAPAQTFESDEEYDALIEGLKNQYKTLIKDVADRAKTVVEELLKRLKVSSAVSFSKTLSGRILVKAVCPACRNTVVLNDAFTFTSGTLTLKCPECAASKTVGGT